MVTIRQRSAKATQDHGYWCIWLHFLAAGAWLYFGGIQGYTLVTPFDTNGVANPLAKEVLTNANPGWINNYSTYPITMIAPIVGILGGFDHRPWQQVKAKLASASLVHLWLSSVQS